MAVSSAMDQHKQGFEHMVAQSVLILLPHGYLSGSGFWFPTQDLVNVLLSQFSI